MNGPTPKQQQVLDHVPRRWATTQAIADAAGMRYASAYQLLAALTRKGLVQTGARSWYRARMVVGTARVEGVAAPELGDGRYWRRPVEVTDEDAAWFAAQLQGIGDYLVELYETEDRRG